MSFKNTIYTTLKVLRVVAQSFLTLSDPMDYGPPGFSVCGISQARILEWIDISSSRESSWPMDRTQVSHIAGAFFTVWATRGSLYTNLIGKYSSLLHWQQGWPWPLLCSSLQIENALQSFYDCFGLMKCEWKKSLFSLCNEKSNLSHRTALSTRATKWR